MYIKLLFLLTFLSTGMQAQDVKWRVDTENTFIQYEGKHLLHEWNGINKKINGIAIQNQKSNQINKIALLLNVKDFDSNNSGRDAHALEVLEALRYPEIKFFADDIQFEGELVKFSGTLEFHGVTVIKKIQSRFEINENILTFNGNFEIVPSDFGIELPSFLTVKVKDLVQISFQIVFVK